MHNLKPLLPELIHTFIGATGLAASYKALRRVLIIAKGTQIKLLVFKGIFSQPYQREQLNTFRRHTP
jgi:hypothetical protein